MLKPEGKPMKHCLQHILSFLLAMIITIILAAPVSAQAVSIDLLPYARASLTQLFGFADEEASEFIFGEQKDDTITFWQPDHPDWIYSVCIDRETGRISGTSPFDTGYMYLYTMKEKALQDLISTVCNGDCFAGWNPQKREDLILLLWSDDVQASTELSMADDAGSAVYGFFESCYGPEFGWTDPLRQLVQKVMDEKGLVREKEPFRKSGIRHGTIIWDRNPAQLTLFDGEIPEELKGVLADPHLEGWKCSSGAVVTLPGFPEQTDFMGNTGSGLAAFEKDGRRQLVQFSRAGEEWAIRPLGENALYRSGDYRVTYDGIHRSFAVEYRLSDTGRASFYLTPSGSGQSFEFMLTAYERLDEATGEAVWISAENAKDPTWKRESPSRQSALTARFPYYLGLVPMEQFPVSEEEIRNDYPGVPDQYALVYGPNFRADASSHSRSYGELKPGVIIPVLDIVPGDPDEWIHTRLGTIEGYVVTGYTTLSSHMSFLVVMPAMAEARKEFSLKHGTGLFDGTVGTYPAGTRMHVVFETGDWLYVDIPSGEVSWLMDPDGTFGYVHKNDVEEMTASCLIDWAE